MYRTWRFARFQSYHRICLCRSSQNRGISLFFSSSFRVEASGVASRWLVHPMVKTVYIPKSRRMRLFRCSLRVRVEKNLAHLARRTAGDGTLARPRQRLVQISGFKYPETAHVLLGLGVRPVGDEHLAVGLGPQRLGLARRGKAAGGLPRARRT